MNKHRINRLFNTSGNCLDVAIDHGLFNERSFLNGIENVEDAIHTIVKAQPDAIQLSVGQAEILQKIAGKHKPALVLRTDVANVYGSELPGYLFSYLIDDAVEQAISLDAAAVVVNLLRLPNQPDLHYQCVRNIAYLKPRCERAGMPLIVEPLVMRDNTEKGGYMVDGDIDKILPLVRQACELGADIIKADPCDNVRDYHRIIDIAGRPVLPRGGGKAPTEEILQRTFELMQQGAKGIVYGRNIIQHENPSGMVRALMAIVHQGADAAQGMRILHQ